MSGINEQFLRTVYRKIPGLAKVNTFIKENVFESIVRLKGSVSVTGALSTPMGAELTIASGVVTVTDPYHPVDSEADAASDDIDTINGGTDGMRVTLRAQNAARTVVLKHNTGNILTFDGGDVSLDATRKAVDLIYDGVLQKWLVQAAGIELLDEDGFSSDSATKGATQQSIKAYVDDAAGVLTKPTGTIESGDKITFADVNDNNTLKQGDIADIVALSSVPTTFGAINTYVLARVQTGAISGGSTIAGSNLRPASFEIVGTGSTTLGSDAKADNVLSGTWRNMGGGTNSGGDTNTSLFVRIS